MSEVGPLTVREVLDRYYATVIITRKRKKIGGGDRPTSKKALSPKD